MGNEYKLSFSAQEIDEKLNQISIPNYEQNNSQGKGYIKNRPFYVDDNGGIHKLDTKFLKTTEEITSNSTSNEIPTAKSVYDLVMPVAVYDNASGFESNNTDPGDSWQLTGLNLGQFKRLKFYVMSAESGSSQTPSHIVEMHLDDRCRGSNGFFTAGHTAIFPESEAKTHNVIFTVNAEKTAICFSKCHRISASTAATSSGGRKCYLIEGYYI